MHWAPSTLISLYFIFSIITINNATLRSLWAISRWIEYKQKERTLLLQFTTLCLHKSACPSTKEERFYTKIMTMTTTLLMLWECVCVWVVLWGYINHFLIKSLFCMRVCLYVGVKHFGNMSNTNCIAFCESLTYGMWWAQVENSKRVWATLSVRRVGITEWWVLC